MLIALAALILTREAASFEAVAEIDALAKTRNADGMMAFAGPEVAALSKPFFFLKSNGPYDTGRFGWSALELRAPGGGQFIVFSTKITSEDYGEFLFAFDGSKLTRYIPETETGGFRIRHQTMDIHFDIPNKRAMLHSSVRIQRAKPGGALLLRLSPHYRVSKLHQQGERTLPFAQAGGIVAIQAPNEPEFTLSMSYSGVVDLPRYAGSITSREALLTNDYWYPMIGRMPATYEATVHVPKNWMAVAQGELAKDIEGPEGRTMTWRMDVPVTYWSLSAAPYSTLSTEVGGRKFIIWSLSMTPEQMKLQAELSAPVLDFYEKTFAKYPFSFWGAVDSPQYGGGALEAYSFATYGSGWLPDEDTHEPAHTWWGGLINNTYLNSLWNESFANYSGGLYHRENPTGNRAEKRLAFIQDADPGPGYAAAPMSKSGVFIGPPSSSLGYGRGADVLQMLEFELGTESMIKSLRHWLANHPKGEPGEWEDFEKAVKAASGRDMTTFFDEWVHRPGFVDFDIENVRWEGGAVVGDVAFRSEPYRLLCEAMLQYPDGKRSFTSIRFEPNGKRASFRIPTAAKPALVSLDPYRRILRPKRDNERPTELASALRRSKRFVDPGRTGWLKNVPSGAAITELPASLDNVFLVGSPDTLPVLRTLCDQAGFRVRGNQLEYDGTIIDLNKGGALAVLELPSGGQCLIGLGQTRRPAQLGRSRLAVFDDFGRFLRGKTDPKTSGFLTARL